MSPFEPTELGPAQQNDVHLYSVWKGFLLDEDPEPTTSDSTSTQQNSVVETLVKELREDALPTRQLPAWNAIRAMPDGSMRCLALLELHFDTENGLLQDPDVKIPAVCSQLEECLKEEGFDADVASAFECLKENCTADALWSLLKCTRPVNLPLVYTLLEAGKKAGDDFEGKDIVALLGETGCGKSTTMHWLAGAEFEEIPQDHGGSKHLKPKGSSLPAACTVGSTMRSETRCVCVVEQQGMLWCDTPGFSDTDLSSEIVNGTIVAAAFNRAKSVLPIGIVGVSDIGPKGVGLVTLIENLMQLIPQADRKHSEFGTSVVYAFTKSDGYTSDQIRNYIAAKLRALSADDPAYKAFEQMKTQCEQPAELCVIQPTSGDPQPFADFVKRKKATEGPGRFKEWLSDKAQKELGSQFGKVTQQYSSDLLANRYIRAKYYYDLVVHFLDLLSEGSAFWDIVSTCFKEMKRKATMQSERLLAALDACLANFASDSSWLPKIVDRMNGFKAFPAPDSPQSTDTMFETGLLRVKMNIIELLSVRYKSNVKVSPSEYDGQKAKMEDLLLIDAGKTIEGARRAKELKDAFRNDFAKQSGTTAIEWFDEEWTSLQNIGERSASLVIDLIKKATPLEAIKLVPTTLLNRTAHDNMSAQAAEWFESQKEKTIDELENDKLKDACTINVSFKDIAALELSILEGEFAEQIVSAIDAAFVLYGERRIAVLRGTEPHEMPFEVVPEILRDLGTAQQAVWKKSQARRFRGLEDEANEAVRDAVSKLSSSLRSKWAVLLETLKSGKTGATGFDYQKFKAEEEALTNAVEKVGLRSEDINAKQLLGCCEDFRKEVSSGVKHWVENVETKSMAHAVDAASFLDVVVLLQHTTGFGLESCTKDLVASFETLIPSFKTEDTARFEPAQLRRAMRFLFVTVSHERVVSPAQNLRTVCADTSDFLIERCKELQESQVRASYLDNVKEVASMMEYASELQVAGPSDFEVVNVAEKKGVSLLSSLDELVSTWIEVFAQVYKRMKEELSRAEKNPEPEVLGTLLSAANALKSVDRFGPFGDDQSSFGHLLQIAGSNLSMLKHGLMAQLRFARQHQQFKAFSDAFARLSADGTEVSEEARMLGQEYGESLLGSLKEIAERVRSLSSVLDNPTTRTIQDCIQRLGNLAGIREITFVSEDTKIELKAAHIDSTKLLEDSIFAFTKAGVLNSTERFRQLDECEALAADMPENWLSFQEKLSEAIQEQWATIKRSYKAEAAEVGRRSAADFYSKPPMLFLSTLKELGPRDECYYAELHTEVCNGIVTGVTAEVQALKDDDEADFDWWQGLNKIIPEDLFIRISPEIDKARDEVEVRMASNNATFLKERNLEPWVSAALTERKQYKCRVVVNAILHLENEVKNFVQDGMLSDALTEAASILDQWQRFAEAAAGNQLPLPLPHTADSLLTRAGDLWTLIESAVVNELKLFLEPFPLRLLQDKWMFLHGACVVEARVRNSGDARGVRVADSYCDAIKKVLEHLSMARFLRDCDSAPSIELCPFLDELRDLDNYVQALNKEKNEGKTFIQRLKELIPPSLLHGATDVVEYAKCVESLKENLAKTVTTANQELKGHPKLPSLTERTTLIKDVSGSLKKLKELTLERLKPHVGDVSVMFKESCGTVGKNLEQIHDAAVEIINGNPWASESRETWDNLNVYCSVLGLAHMHLDPEHHNLPQKARSFLDYVRRILNDTLDSCFADSTKITIETFVERLLYLKAMAVHTSEVQALLTRVICGLLQKQDPGRLASLRELLQSCQATNQQAYARQMIEEHKEFDNIAVRYRNVRTQVDAESLLKMMLKDTSNTKLDAKKLLELHRKFEKEYWVVLDEDLQLMREEKTKEDLVRRAKKIGEGVFSIDNTVTMVVCVFAYWTLSFEDSVQLLLGPKDPKRPDEYRGGITKPNAGQVLSIFRLLGLDGSDGKNFKNHFAEILTGQGKSIVTAAVAIIAALLGYSVDCICYSTYLSARDKADFSHIFRAFGVAKDVRYGTLKDQCEQLINRHSDIRQLVVSLLNGEASSGTLGKQAGSKKRFAIIDEVDVLLQEDFYSEEYCVFAMLQREEVTALAAHLWRQHKKKKLTIEDLKTTLETVEGAACVGCLGPKWNPLMEAAVQHMVAALVNFSSHEGKYVVCKKRQKIGYRRADHKVDFEISYGYSTMWAYFKEHDNHAVTLESRNGKTGLNIDCGCFSYAQIPQQYDVVVGLTGTLKWLSETERAVLKEEYNVEGYTYVPSVYPTNHALVFAGDTAEGVMLNKPDEHYTCIVDAVKQCQDKVKRPVIVFFETRTLDDFLKSNVSKQLRGVQELREGMDDDNIAACVKAAGHLGKITLATDAFSRGTDFVCHGDSINDAGGLHVIQTYVSRSPAAFNQITGRTNRQGNKGSFAMILNQQALEGIGIDENCVKKMKDENKRLTTINKSRSELYDLDCQKNREKARVLHEVHEEGMRFLHTLIKTPDSADVVKFLNERNRGFSSAVTAHARVIIMMDATLSMGPFLDALKSTIQGTLDRVSGIGEMYNCLPSLQFVAYRNYNAEDVDELLSVSGWETSVDNIKTYLDSVELSCGLGAEAIEAALWHFNKMQKEGIVHGGLLIGDREANTRDAVTEKRAYRSGAQEEYWVKTIGTATYYEDELSSIESPIHAFYCCLDEDLPETKNCFETIATKTGGAHAFLDIQDQKQGANKLAEAMGVCISKAIGGTEAVEAYYEKYGHVFPADALWKQMAGGEERMISVK
ncbi:Protein translocase subunit SecA [Diplonema papillatum]|nr:Protein translocase subunit SecA [Diplonema papillatum]KAJ9445284.1 Protein translocase subunit SecA [Diplonema papillatum]KAJ9445285.1 Protein translocase subunit SecA [Diplonema papillatum]